MLSNDIKYLKGVGEKKAGLLNKELEIYKFNDLLYYFPFKYVDKTKFYRLDEVYANMPYIQAKGRITTFRTIGEGMKKRLVANFSDGTDTIELVWFKGIKWIKENYKKNKEYIIFGKPSEFKGEINIAHPDIEDPEENKDVLKSALEANYNTSDKLKQNYITSKTIHRLQYNLLLSVKDEITETLPEAICRKVKVISLKEALLNIHFPQSADLLRKAQNRLKFEELFYIQLNLLYKKLLRTNKFKGFIFEKVGDYFNIFYKKHLAFDLTNAQKRVIREIRKDMGSGQQMNRLLQGDVGSGKTLVALMAVLIALDNNFQACLMAPTEILALQHFLTISQMLGDMQVTVGLLTGSTKQKERKIIHEQLESGELQILIGTHALIEDEVKFHNLGLAIIDEQHRFGVAQRAKLWQKSANPPHVLVMTATPIPRTLGMTLYSDLEISVIDEMPPGRKPVKTFHRYDSQRLPVFNFLKQEIKKGRQVYIVYPLIYESDKMPYKDLEDGLESISRAFPSPEYSIGVLHGQMKPEEKENAMHYFAKGITKILVATTVIEVGVNVPNASVMLIESAERFGLSQLHQLRGRVGRGAEQSFCILMTSVKLTSEARRRINTMVDTNDGFKIAEVDLRLRGMGDLEGLRQSGVPLCLKIADLIKDDKILKYARDIAVEILHDDPNLAKPENTLLIKQLKKQKGNYNWGVIS